MPVYEVRSFKELHKLLTKHINQKQKKIEKAVKNTVKYAAEKIATLVPVAFEDLKDSIHTTDTTVTVDAPHAASVEMGSRPHTPPLEPLIKWVKLMGAKGLTDTGRVRTAPKVPYGSLSLETGQRRQDFHARTTARAIKAFRYGKKAVNVNAPEYVARAIQKAIMISGTKPTFFVRNPLPDIENELITHIRAIFDEDE